MARITFKAKVETMYNADDTEAYKFVRVPKFERRHCDMHAFRFHAKYGSYANSVLFPAMLDRIHRDTFKGGMLKLNDIPPNVTIDASGFLAIVTLDV